jgi:hypothetical protein
MKKHLFSLAACIALLSAATLRAQAVPVPAPILSAKTIFLGNAGTNTDGDSERAYEGFYQQLVAWNHYKVVTDPAEADLVAEIAVNSSVTATTQGNSGENYFIHVILRDEKTHTLLWDFSEYASGGGSRKTILSSFNNAITRLATDLKALAAGTLPARQGEGPAIHL